MLSKCKTHCPAQLRQLDMKGQLKNNLCSQFATINLGDALIRIASNRQKQTADICMDASKAMLRKH